MTGYIGKVNGLTWDDLIKSAKLSQKENQTDGGGFSQEWYATNPIFGYQTPDNPLGGLRQAMVGFGNPTTTGTDSEGNPIQTSNIDSFSVKNYDSPSSGGYFSTNPTYSTKYVRGADGGVDMYSEEHAPSWFDSIAPTLPIAAAIAGSGVLNTPTSTPVAAGESSGLGGGAFDLGGISGGVEGAGGATGLESAFGIGSGSGASSLSSGLSSLKNIGGQLLQHPDLLATGAGLINKLIGGSGGTENSGGGALSNISGNWTPSQQNIADNYFNKSTQREVNPYNGNLARAPIEGGEHQWFKQMKNGGHVSTDTHGGGQDDVVPIMAAPGEFVMDADTVSALGDGSSEEGIRKLEQFREMLRKHKRSAPSDSIPPRALPIQNYMRGK